MDLHQYRLRGLVRVHYLLKIIFRYLSIFILRQHFFCVTPPFIYLCNTIDNHNNHKDAIY